MNIVKSNFAVRVLAALALVVAFSATSLAFSANSTPANIPFEFEVRGVKMPAGRYHFTAGPATGLVSIIAADGRQFAVGTTPLGDPNKPVQPKLVFRFDGAVYRLSEVWLSNDNVGKAVPQPKSADITASNGTKAKRVEVALVR
jgi:hypothetical protein